MVIDDLEQRRFKLRFPSREGLEAALAVESAVAEPVVVNEKRGYVSFAAAPQMMAHVPGPEMAGVLAEGLSVLAREYGAELVEDYQYQIDQGEPDILTDVPEAAEDGTLRDVTAMIRADEAWQLSRGKDVVIAIVDTGVDGSHPEFPASKRSGGWAVPGDDPWSDYLGHGTMCACVAAAAGSRYQGVAPDAMLMSCKTRFYDSELGLIYDTLAARVGEGKQRIVASNSFGRKVGTPPPDPADSDFLPALDDAVAAGVVVVFSAGNNHALAGGAPTGCSPTSIWLHKSRADIAAVATCDLDQTMWYYSSRGPGQHYGMPATNHKPDVTAPTPRNGKILYGDGERVLGNGWGTSGACPQVAGLAALILARDGNIGSSHVFDIIRDSAVPMGHGHDCEGRGLIDCYGALAAMAVV